MHSLWRSRARSSPAAWSPRALRLALLAATGVISGVVIALLAASGELKPCWAVSVPDPPSTGAAHHNPNPHLPGLHIITLTLIASCSSCTTQACWVPTAQLTRSWIAAFMMYGREISAIPMLSACSCSHSSTLGPGSIRVGVGRMSHVDECKSTYLSLGRAVSLRLRLGIGSALGA